MALHRQGIINLFVQLDPAVINLKLGVVWSPLNHQAKTQAESSHAVIMWQMSAHPRAEMIAGFKACLRIR